MADNQMQDMQMQSASGDVVRDQDKIMLVLAYLGLLALIPLLTVKDSEYVKWHAKQGIALCACWFAFSIGTTMLAMIPMLGLILGLAGCVGHLGFLALMIMAIVKAFEPLRWRIPVVANLADKF